MENKTGIINSVTKFLWAIVGLVASVVGILLMFRKNGDTIIQADDALSDSQDDIDVDIDDLKNQINNIDTSDMSDSDVADYFNNKDE